MPSKKPSPKPRKINRPRVGSTKWFMTGPRSRLKEATIHHEKWLREQNNASGHVENFSTLEKIHAGNDEVYGRLVRKRSEEARANQLLADMHVDASREIVEDAQDQVTSRRRFVKSWVGRKLRLAALPKNIRRLKGKIGPVSPSKSKKKAK